MDNIIQLFIQETNNLRAHLIQQQDEKIALLQELANLTQQLQWKISAMAEILEAEVLAHQQTKHQISQIMFSNSQ